MNKTFNAVIKNENEAQIMKPFLTYFDQLNKTSEFNKMKYTNKHF